MSAEREGASFKEKLSKGAVKVLVILVVAGVSIGFINKWLALA
jgi:hypothetical protein